METFLENPGIHQYIPWHHHIYWGYLFGFPVLVPGFGWNRHYARSVDILLCPCHCGRFHSCYGLCRRPLLQKCLYGRRLSRSPLPILFRLTGQRSSASDYLPNFNPCKIPYVLPRIQVLQGFFTAPICIDHTNFLLYTVYSDLWNNRRYFTCRRFWFVMTINRL